MTFTIAALVSTLARCWVIADRGFDSKDFRNDLVAAAATTCIPPRKSSRIQYHFSRALSRHRHSIENFFARIKEFGRVATRYEKLTETLLGFVIIYMVVDWLLFEV